MPPKINENWSKNRSGADLGPLIVGFLAFWSDAKKSRIFDASPVGQKSGKSDKQAAWRAPRRERGTTFWELGPWGGALFARGSYKQRAKETRNMKQETRNEKQALRNMKQQET